MATYPGEWSVALVDLDCAAELHVHPDHFQYAASAGKIVPVIAALRAVDERTVTLPRPWQAPGFGCGGTADPGLTPGAPIDLEQLEPALFLVMRHSCDQEADLINRMVTPEQIAEVLEVARAEDTTIEHSWRIGGMTALDLARVWAALLDGRLLGDGLTTYLLDLASRAEIPEGFTTFPATTDIPGYQLGQKAGYCAGVCQPYSLIALGAGYLRPVERLSPPDVVGATVPAEHKGVAMVLMAQTTAAGGGPQRREVYPLLAAYVIGR